MLDNGQLPFTLWLLANGSVTFALRLLVNRSVTFILWLLVKRSVTFTLWMLANGSVTFLMLWQDTIPGQLTGRIVYSGWWFHRGRALNSREGMAAGGWSRKLKDHIFNYKQGGGWGRERKSAKLWLLNACLQWCTSKQGSNWGPCVEASEPVGPFPI